MQPGREPWSRSSWHLGLPLTSAAESGGSEGCGSVRAFVPPLLVHMRELRPRDKASALHLSPGSRSRFYRPRGTGLTVPQNKRGAHLEVHHPVGHQGHHDRQDLHQHPEIGDVLFGGRARLGRPLVRQQLGALGVSVGQQMKWQLSSPPPGPRVSFISS